MPFPNEKLDFPGVYAVWHRDSGKVYVGSSINVERRWREHKNRLAAGTHNNRHLQRAWELYGAEAFEFALLAKCAAKTLFGREQVFIDELRAAEPEYGYNINPVAESCRNRTLTDEHKRKVGDANRGRRPAPAALAASVARRIGRKLSPEHVARAAAARRGKACGEAHHAAKVTDLDVTEIRRLAASGVSQRRIGTRFGINQATVSKIVRRRLRNGETCAVPA